MSMNRVPNLQSTLGDRLRSERVRLGLTQETLADRTGISTRSIAGYELGTTTIRQDFIYRLENVGIDMAYVLFGDGTEGSAVVDDELFERVNRWADVSCREPDGTPIPDWERLQRVARAYRWLASSRDKKELEERFAQLPAVRAS